MSSVKKKITHLYWRAGFGISLKMLDQASESPLKITINKLINDAKNPELLDMPLPVYQKILKEGRTKKQQDVLRKKLNQENQDVKVKWIRKMVASDNPLLERMTLFWHGHFALVSGKSSHFTKTYLNTLRKHALGNFGDLVLAIARDPAMIHFLNNRQNKKGQPNENFARELLELFTIGIGHYTEEDVKEAARAFTGWRTDKKGNFLFSERHHDFDRKTFMGQTGTLDGTDIIRIVLENKQTAKFIATKVYRYFVNERIDEQHVQRLADVFYNSNYNIEKLMRTVFASDWFYADKNIGIKIKSPVDLLIGMMKTLQMDLKTDKSFFFIQKIMGQSLLNPPNVAGWPGGKNWIDSSTLIFRLNLAGYLFQNVQVDMAAKPEPEDKADRKIKLKLATTMDVSPILNYLSRLDEAAIFSTLSEWLIQADFHLEKTELDPFIRHKTRNHYVKSLLLRLMTLPEYQVC